MSPKQKKRRDTLRPLWQRLKGLWRRFSRLPEEDIISDEPIDFSAPSVPYYANLSERFNLARIILYMILVAFVVVTLISSRHLITYENLYYLVKDVGAATLTAQSQADYLSYPISGGTSDFVLYRGGLTIVGNQEITVLSGSGQQTLSENVSYANPCVRAGEQYFMTFSRGERDFAVYNAFVRVHKEQTEFPVYDACMSREGSFAVLTRSREYTSEVIFYDSDMDKLAAVHLGGYATAMSVSADGKTLAVLSLTLGERGYTTKLTLLRRGLTGVTDHDLSIEGATALTAEFITDDRVAVIFEDRMCIYRVDGELLSTVSFESGAPILCQVKDGYAALLCAAENHLLDRVLRVIDKNGKEVYRMTLPAMSDPKELLLQGKDVYIRLSERILYVSHEGERLAWADIHRDTTTVLLHEAGNLLACCPAFAQRLDEKDFAPLS